MNHRITVGASLAVALLCGSLAYGADAPKSGPQVGEKIPGAFNVLNVCNAELANRNGTKSCLV